MLEDMPQDGNQDSGGDRHEKKVVTASVNGGLLNRQSGFYALTSMVYKQRCKDVAS